MGVRHLAAAAATAFFCHSALACDLQVTSTADAGAGSLREAIATAAAGQEICFEPLTTPATIELDSDDLDIDKALSITGPGRDLLSIEGGNDRVFQIEPASAVAVAISGLEIANSETSVEGGGIAVSEGVVTLTALRFVDNVSVNDGGALFVSGGTVTVTDSEFSGNEAADDGGAVEVDGASVTVRTSSFTDNFGSDDGGAIRVSSGGSLVVEDATFTGNYSSGADGGAVMVDGSSASAIVRRSILSMNRAFDDGGAVAVDNGGSMTLEDSLLALNQTEDEHGGAAYVDGGGELILERCLVYDNDAEGGAGGLYVDGDSDGEGSLTLRNTTVSGNSDEGIFINNGATAILEHVTVTGNSEEGVYVTNDGGTVTLTNSLLTGNDDEDIDVSSSHPDRGAVYLSTGYNVISAVGRVPFDNNTTGDLYGDNRGTTTPAAGATEVDGVIDTRLLPADGNGFGAFLTHALDTDSPALNHIPAGTAGCGTTYTEDQRGIARPAKGACDAGAYENDDVGSVYVELVSDQYNPVPGEIVEFTATLINVDLGAAQTGIALDNPLPAELAVVGSVELVGGNGGATGSPPALLSGLELAGGDSATVTYRARVAAAATTGEVLRNRILLTTDTQLTPREIEVRPVVRPSDTDSDGVADDVDVDASDSALPADFPARVYLVDEDNENNLGTGLADGDFFPTDVGFTNIPHPVEFNIPVTEARPTRNAFVAMLVEDVDFPLEVNDVYLNGVRLGSTVGANNLLNTTLLTVPDTSIVRLGNNLVEVQVNVNFEKTYWTTSVQSGQLITDFTGDALNNAGIRSLAIDTDPAGYGATVTVTLEADTNLTAQDVRVELILRDAAGIPVTFDDSDAARRKTLTGASDDPHEWTFDLPGSGQNGIWSITAVLYDFDSGEFSDLLSIPVAVPDTADAAPQITAVSPQVGEAGAAVVIDGLNFLAGATSCEIGGEALENLLVLGNTQITANVSAGLMDAGLYDVQCTTTYGSDTLEDAFELRVRRRLEVILAGSGEGVVVADSGAIDCGATCADSYDDGTGVLLTAAPQADSIFTGWSGPCSGTADCALTLDADATVSASFARRNTYNGNLPGGGPAVSVESSGGGNNVWVFTESGDGPLQTAGFIPLSGHPKSPAQSPPKAHNFRWGLFDFVLEFGDAGSDATVVITYPEAFPASTRYWKYGPTSTEPTPHWHVYPHASVSGNTITLTLTDGGRGDSDLSINRLIDDPGGPAVGPGPAAVPSMPQRWLLLVTLLCLAVLGWRYYPLSRGVSS